MECELRIRFGELKQKQLVNHEVFVLRLEEEDLANRSTLGYDIELILLHH